MPYPWDTGQGITVILIFTNLVNGTFCCIASKFIRKLVESNSGTDALYSFVRLRLRNLVSKFDVFLISAGLERASMLDLFYVLVLK